MDENYCERNGNDKVSALIINNQSLISFAGNIQQKLPCPHLHPHLRLGLYVIHQTSSFNCDFQTIKLERLSFFALPWSIILLYSCGSANINNKAWFRNGSESKRKFNSLVDEEQNQFKIFSYFYGLARSEWKLSKYVGEMAIFIFLCVNSQLSENISLI